MHIRKGDQVKILTGKDRGKIGKVLAAYPKREKVTIGGANIYKKRVKPKKRGDKGEVVLVPRPISASNALLVCGSCKKPTRVGMRREKRTVVRYCKKCKAET